MDGIRFILGMHAHQPTGNLPELLAEAPRYSSLPCLEVLKDPSLFALAEGASVQAACERVVQPIALLPHWVSGGPEGVRRLRSSLTPER
jgi:hypothetical protein